MIQHDMVVSLSMISAQSNGQRTAGVHQEESLPEML